MLIDLQLLVLRIIGNVQEMPFSRFRKMMDQWIWCFCNLMLIDVWMCPVEWSWYSEINLNHIIGYQENFLLASPRYTRAVQGRFLPHSNQMRKNPRLSRILVMQQVLQYLLLWHSNIFTINDSMQDVPLRLFLLISDTGVIIYVG